MKKMHNMWNYIDERKLVFNISGVSHHVLCGICNNILRNASYTKCGCRFCAQCIGDYLSSGGGHLCPGCLKEGTNMDLSEDSEVVVDPVGNKEVAKLRLRCPHAGCCDSVEMKTMMAHLSVCEYGSVRTCLFGVVGCVRADLADDEIDRHLREDQRLHNKLVMDFVIDCRESDAELRRQLKEIRDKLEKIVNCNDELKIKLSGVEKEEIQIDNLEKFPNNFKSKLLKKKINKNEIEFDDETYLVMNQMKSEVTFLANELVSVEVNEKDKLFNEDFNYNWIICNMDEFENTGTNLGEVFQLNGYNLGFSVKYFIQYNYPYVHLNLILYRCNNVALEWPLKCDLWVGIVDPTTKEVIVKKKFGFRHSRLWMTQYSKPIEKCILSDSSFIVNPCVYIPNWEGKFLILRCGMMP